MLNVKISELLAGSPLIGSFQNGDAFEMARQVTPGVWQSYGCTYFQFLTDISATLPTIYSADAALAANRTVDLLGHTLTFNGLGGSRYNVYTGDGLSLINFISNDILINNVGTGQVTVQSIAGDINLQLLANDGNNYDFLIAAANLGAGLVGITIDSSDYLNIQLRNDSVWRMQSNKPVASILTIQAENFDGDAALVLRASSSGTGEGQVNTVADISSFEFTNRVDFGDNTNSTQNIINFYKQDSSSALTSLSINYTANGFGLAIPLFYFEETNSGILAHVTHTLAQITNLTTDMSAPSILGNGYNPDGVTSTANSEAMVAFYDATARVATWGYIQGEAATQVGALVIKINDADRNLIDYIQLGTLSPIGTTGGVVPNTRIDGQDIQIQALGNLDILVADFYSVSSDNFNVSPDGNNFWVISGASASPLNLSIEAINSGGTANITVNAQDVLTLTGGATQMSLDGTNITCLAGIYTISATGNIALNTSGGIVTLPQYASGSLPTPSSGEKGFVTTNDTNQLMFWNGTAWSIAA